MSPPMTDPEPLRNRFFVQAVQSIDEDLFEETIDLLTVIANKPTNYSRLKNYTTTELWKIARNYAKARHPDRDAEIEIAIGELEKAFEKAGVNIVTLDGLKVPRHSENSSPSTLYYESEEHLQDIVLEIFGESIHESIASISSSKSSFEREVFSTWLLYLLEKIEVNPRLVELDMAQFGRVYRRAFDKELKPNVTADMIREVLTRGRLAYPAAEKGRLVPLWITTNREWLAPLILQQQQQKQKQQQRRNDA